MAALATYNERTSGLAPNAACSRDTLLAYADIHHLLTARYIGRNGYRYAWPDIRSRR